MAGPYPLATLAATIGAAGISIPAFADALASLQTSFRNIYGQDVDLSADTQDGALLAIFAKAYGDMNDLAVAAYQSFSPTYAQGIGLSSLVKLNGLRRKSPTFSTVTANVEGTVGITILSGIVVDDNNNQWTLPINTEIPISGAVLVTLTCSTAGTITVPQGTSLTLVNPQPGWNAVTTTTDTQPGLPVEMDATLRQRQSVSTSQPALSPLQSILAAIANIPGIGRYAIYENDSPAFSPTGLPPHTISVVCEGGDVTAIASAIQSKKIPGCGTYGSTAVSILDPAGVPDTIRFFYLTELAIYFAITLRPRQGYSAATGNLILSSVAIAIATLPEGQNVEYDKLWSAANLSGTAAINATTASGNTLTQAQLDVLSSTYEITVFTIGTSPSPIGTADIVVPFQVAATTTAANGTLTLLPAA